MTDAFAIRGPLVAVYWVLSKYIFYLFLSYLVKIGLCEDTNNSNANQQHAISRVTWRTKIKKKSGARINGKTPNGKGE